MTQKHPLEISPTHEYRFTRTIRMQFNYEYHVVRVLSNDVVVQDWQTPTITVDLNKFALMPHPSEDFTKFNKHYVALQRKGDLIKFMAKWRQRLPADEYMELLEDVRAAILLSEMDLTARIKQGKTPEVALASIVCSFE